MSRHTKGLLAVLGLCAVASCARLRHPSMKRTADGTYSIKLDNHHAVQYSAPLTVGEQTLPVIYDTGSFEVIVLSTLCTMCTQTTGKYDIERSPSYESGNQAGAEHFFGSGNVISFLGFDTVKFGDKQSPFVKTHMPFWQVLKHGIAVWDASSSFSGIVGLAHPDRIPMEMSPTAESQGGQDEVGEATLHAMKIHRFSICLERGPGAPGWLTVEPAMPQGVFQKIPVTGDVHWAVTMTDFQVPHPHLDFQDPCKPSCGAILDSGTSLIAVPSSASHIVTALRRLIRHDCSNFHELPVLRMKLGGVTVDLPASSYVMQIAPGANLLQNSSYFAEETRTSTAMSCSPAFMTIDMDTKHGPLWILGMPFLRHYITVFDRAEKTVHIARSTPACKIDRAHVAGSLLNTTQGVDFGSSEDASADRLPTQVDLQTARMPTWSHGSDVYLKV